MHFGATAGTCGHLTVGTGWVESGAFALACRLAARLEVHVGRVLNSIAWNAKETGLMWGPLSFASFALAPEVASSEA